MADGPLLEQDGSVNLGSELDIMRATGVQSVRVTFVWSIAQPYRNFAAVPQEERHRFVDAGGVPTDFSATDRIVRATARRGLSLLPVVLYSPAWASSNRYSPGAPPANPKTFARFLTAVARRYGTRGTFWSRNPGLRRVPIRNWQIWNEPNIPFYWPQPSARAYVKLLRAAYPAVKRTDPHARVILAGLTNDSWNALRAIYRAGGRRYFDVVALHPFSRRVRDLVKFLAFTRYCMKRYHDSRKPLLISEMSWPSAAGRVPPIGFNEVTEAQQADRVSAAFRLLAKYRRHFRIEAAYWYTWLSIDRGDNYFSYSGLRTMSESGPAPKPAFRAFRRVVRRIE
jgi:arabinogalactan endo-1,4-beta-galactosidase